MTTSSDLSPEQIALLRDPTSAGPGYDGLTQLQLLVDLGYLSRAEDGKSYVRTEKGNGLVT